MKKISMLLCLIMIVMLLCFTFTACDSTKENTNKLVVYNWEDYIEPEVLDSFADYYKSVTGIKLDITYTTFDTNETMMTKMLAGDATVDLICPSEYSIERLMTNDILLNLNDLAQQLKTKYPNYSLPFNNLANMESDITSKLNAEFSNIKIGDKTKPMTEYMVAYMWGTLGILYNPKYVTEADIEKGWGLLWNRNNNKNLNGKILVKDSVRDTYCAAVLYMYEYDLLPSEYKDYSIQQLINCTDSTLLEAAEKVLTEQREFISGYEVDFGKDDMLNEIAYADLAWSGDALWAIEEAEAIDMELDYFTPTVGANVWFDGWCIPKCSNNNLAALMFIDYMCRPDIAMQNSMAIGYTSAVEKDLLMASDDAKAILTDNEYDIDDYFADTRRYPTIDASFGIMHDFGKSNDTVVAMWERAKSGSSVPMILVYIVVAILGLVIIATSAYFIKERLKLRRKIISK